MAGPQSRGVVSEAASDSLSPTANGGTAVGRGTQQNAPVESYRSRGREGLGWQNPNSTPFVGLASERT